MIGVFDSGFGGLSIVSQILTQNRRVAITYVADHKYIPYGSKTNSQIQQRAHAISNYLISRQAKIILIACNTATAASIDSLRHTFSVPFVGIEPAVKPASTTPGQAYILATAATIRSLKYYQLLAAHQSSNIKSLTFPLWVDLVEKHFPLSPAHLNQLKQDLQVFPLHSTISLSCTHYIFLKAAISRLRPDISIIDPSVAVAKQALKLYSGLSTPPKLEIFSTNVTKQTSKQASNLLTAPIQVKSIYI